MVRTVVVMDTFVTINVVEPAHNSAGAAAYDDAISRAFEWFDHIEKCCSRFDAASEVTALASRPGVAVPVSTMLFEALQFALTLADDTGGAFDPTVGAAMEKRGFNRDYRTGRIVDTPVAGSDRPSYRDVVLDPEHRTVTLTRPLMLDLGAVAKGLAIDMAARELAPFENFAIDAGGDVYLAGSNPAGLPWSVGIRHPREDDAVIETLLVSDRAVCTSGDYERRPARGDGGHILDPRTEGAARALISATVVAPNAMLADALATAAFVLGPSAGIDLLNRHGVAGLLISPALERHVTEAPLES